MSDSRAREGVKLSGIVHHREVSTGGTDMGKIVEEEDELRKEMKEGQEARTW